MSCTPIVKEETNRLAALHEYGIETELFDPSLNKLINLASNIFNVPIVLVSLLESERQLFAAGLGVSFTETPIEIAFCTHAIHQEGILVIPDASKDPNFKDNPLVTGEPHLRFYAGIPLRNLSGYAIGALCIIDIKPRLAFSVRDEHNLQDLAMLVMDRLEARRLNLSRKIGPAVFEKIAKTSTDAVICVDEKGIITFWNPSAQRMLEYAGDEIIGHSVDTVIPDYLLVQFTRLATDKAWLAKGVTLELNVRTKSGVLFLVELSVSMWKNDDAVSYGVILRDTKERRRNEERLFLLAHMDPLTGLANRALLTSNLEQTLKNKSAACIMLIDLDGFKNINDSLGHDCGDDILVSVAKKIQMNVRTGDLAARMGGDEFVLLFPGMDDRDEAATIAEQVIHNISQTMIAGEGPLNVSASVGIVFYPIHGLTAQELLASADLALLQAKSEGRNCYRFFTRVLRENFQAKHAFQSEFARAYKKHEFEVFYQPLVDLSNNEIVGAEALLRWRHPHKGLLSPGAFLSALECGTWAEYVGDWVMLTACKQAAEWHHIGAKDFRISVNLFSAQFRSGMLSQKIADILKLTGLPASSLEVEITENIILRHDKNMLQPLYELRDAGIGIAFDDYGTGYASLSVLKNYPVTRLKIDQSFVRTMCESPTDAAIVWAIIYLGKSFGLGIVAEGIETLEPCEQLKNRGCDEAQGYLFGHPMSAKEFTNLLKSRHRLAG
ncbi:EAL domain-containing protein [Brenneria izadpanahii]|uniref:EAL domain-containing protein n=1 Tax=Brenneria izadpanahii TaxID=2722756 RepID=A0ABX7UR68_9GAMM|nr:EAL domain-containing protein [Brenneria izadpanahii]QTF08226.1 EAL domain-containing protein [Brenneria izadpanahii]